MLVVAKILILLISFYGVTANSQLPQPSFWRNKTPLLGNEIPTSGPPCFNGDLKGVEPVTPERMIVYGWFDQVGDCVGGGLFFDLTTGARLEAKYPLAQTMIGGEGIVAVSDNAGGWYIGGLLGQVGNLKRNVVARILANGTVDVAFAPPEHLVGGAISDMKLDSANNVLYVAGGIDSVTARYGSPLDSSGSTIVPFAWLYEQDVILNAFSNGESPMVEVAIPDGVGGWYVGGNFMAIRGNHYRYNLIRLLPDGTLDVTWQGGTGGGRVRSLYLDGGTLYVGGDFVTLAGVTRAGLGAVSAAMGIATSWNPKAASVYAIDKAGSDIVVGGSFSLVAPTGNVSKALLFNESDEIEVASFPTFDGPVYSIISDGSGGWYVGGRFYRVNGSPNPCLVRVRSDYSVTSVGFENVCADDGFSKVTSLALNGTELFVGGNFSGLRRLLASVDTTTDTLTAWQPDFYFYGTIYALHVSGSRLYVGGDINMSTPFRYNLFALDLPAKTLSTDWATTSAGYVYALASYGGNIYIGGGFTHISGTPRSSIAAVDINGALISFNPSCSGTVKALSVVGDKLLVGGTFTAFGGTARTNFAEYDLTLSANTSFDPAPNGVVNSIAVANGKLYLGGDFTTVLSTARRRYAEVDNTTKALVSSNLNVDRQINSLTVDANFIAVGGDFSFSEVGTARVGLAAFDATTAAVTTWDPQLSGVTNLIVRDIAVSDSNTVYATGNFLQVGGTSRSRLAEIQLSDATATTWNPSLNGQGFTLVFDTNSVYVGGEFTSINGTGRNRLAAISRSTGALEPINYNLTSTRVRSLYLDGTGLLIGGELTFVNGVARSNVAEVNPTTGAVSDWNPRANGPVYTVSRDGAISYVGGSFSRVGGIGRDGVAALNAITGEILPWDPEVGNSVLAIELGSSSVFLAGDFTASKGLVRQRVVEVELATAVSKGNPTAFTANANARVRDILLDEANNRLYIAGDFSTLAGSSRSGFGVVNKTTGALDPFNPAKTGNIVAMNLNANHIYLGGTVTSFVTEAVTALLRLDRTSMAIDTGWKPNILGGIADMTLDGNYLGFTGWNISQVMGQARNYAAVIDVSTNQLSPFNFPNMSDNGWLAGIAIQGNEVLALGLPVYINPTMAGGIFAINPQNGRRTDWRAGKVGDTSWGVNVVQTHGNSAFIGGNFSDFDGETRYAFAEVNMFTGNLTDWQPIQSTSAYVEDIQVEDNKLFVGGGNFGSIYGQPRTGLSIFNLLDMSLDATNIEFDDVVSVMHRSGSKLYVGGWFTQVNSTPRNRFVAFDYPAMTLNSLTIDVNDNVYSILQDGNDLFVGGEFSYNDVLGGWVDWEGIAKFNATTGARNMSFIPPFMWAEIWGIAKYNNHLYLNGGFYSHIGETMGMYNIGAINANDASSVGFAPFWYDYFVSDSKSRVVLYDNTIFMNCFSYGRMLCAFVPETEILRW